MIAVHGKILALLTFLFLLRVAGQALVEIIPVDWLPGSEAWASGLLPYPALLAAQIVMLMVLAKIVKDVNRESGLFAERWRWSGFLIGVSKIYAAGMALRYVLTMIFFPDMRWFGGVIPISFHFVLAAFLYTWGRFLKRGGIFASTDPAC